MRLLSKSAELVESDESEVLAQIRILRGHALAPFSEKPIKLLLNLSKQILTSTACKAFPQLIALGFWLRRASLDKIAKDFDTRMLHGQIAAPRGVALHLPPQNVDTIFVYSWALSVLAGNTNIVRLPSSQTAASELLYRLIVQAMNDCGEAERHLFCNYTVDSDFARKVSANCDLRLIWGGNQKIKDVSEVPTQPDGLTIGFPDRKSFAVISSAAYIKAALPEREKLAQQFYNDIFWFDQLGCGSPRIIFWVGKGHDHDKDLYERIVRYAIEKNVHPHAGLLVEKFVQMNMALAQGVAVNAHRYGNLLDVIESGASFNGSFPEQGGGFLMSVEVNELADVRFAIGGATQTICHFGFSAEEIKQFAVSMIGVGGFRLVPVGQALLFDSVWDGIHLLSHMTRLISFR